MDNDDWIIILNFDKFLKHFQGKHVNVIKINYLQLFFISIGIIIIFNTELIFIASFYYNLSKNESAASQNTTKRILQYSKPHKMSEIVISRRTLNI